MARLFAVLVLLGGSLTIPIQADTIRAQLKDGIVSYMTEDGQRKSIDVGGKCRDLWVAPDESMFAFIAIEQTRGLEPTGEPFILASSVYIARRTEHFVPMKIPLKPVQAYGRDWEIFRTPKVSPDGATLFFNIPTSTTQGKVYSYQLGAGLTSEIGDAVVYCVVWYREQSGTILMQRRRIIDLKLRYSCYAKPASSSEVKVADECDDFVEFSLNWSRAAGGRCN